MPHGNVKDWLTTGKERLTTDLELRTTVMELLSPDYSLLRNVNDLLTTGGKRLRNDKELLRNANYLLTDFCGYRQSAQIRISSGNRVETTAAPGMAANNSSQAKPASFDGTVLFQCFNRIGRATGFVAARTREMRGNNELIAAHQRHEEFCQHLSGCLVFAAYLPWLFARPAKWVWGFCK